MGKQRSEVLQIAKCLAGIPSSWKNHPAVVMWRGNEGALIEYQRAMCHEWHHVRGYSDTCLESTYELVMPLTESDLSRDKPWWLGDEAFHAAHRANLYRKDPKHYEEFATEEHCPYLWPLEKPGCWK